MSTTRSLAITIHDTIDEVATTVEDIHRSVANLPLNVLGVIKPLQGPLEEVRAAQARSIGAVYGLVRRINRRVQRLTIGALPQ